MARPSIRRIAGIPYESKLKQMVVAMLKMRPLPLLCPQWAEDRVTVLCAWIGVKMRDVAEDFPLQPLTRLVQR